MRTMFALALLGLVGCGAGEPGSDITNLGGDEEKRPGSVPAGTWGGEHVTMEVSAAGAAIEYDCAAGTIDERLALDRTGAIDVRGAHVREHGGPIREGEVPDRHPARYTGTLAGRTLTLTVQLTDSGASIGTYTLTPGGGRVFKCL